MTELKDLAQSLIEAKAEEDWARKERIAIEEQIAALVPGPDSGQKTIKLDNGVSITVKRGWNYKANVPEIEAWFEKHNAPLELPDARLTLPIKTKTTRELDEKGYDWYRDHNPEVFSAMAKHVTVTPKKISVVVDWK